MADLGGSTYSLRIKAVLDTSQMRQELNRLNGNPAAPGGPGRGGPGGSGFNPADLAQLNAIRELSKTMKAMNGTMAPIAKDIPKTRLVTRGLSTGTWKDRVGDPGLGEDIKKLKSGTFYTKMSISPKSSKQLVPYINSARAQIGMFGSDVATARAQMRSFVLPWMFNTRGPTDENVSLQRFYKWKSRAAVLREKGLDPAKVASVAWAPGSREAQLQRYTNLYRNQIGMKGIYFNSAGRTLQIKKGYGSIVNNELAAMRAERAAASAQISAASKAAKAAGGGRGGFGRFNRGALGIAAMLATDAFSSSEYGNKGPLNAKSYFGNIAAQASEWGIMGGMAGGPWGAAIGAVGGGLYGLFGQNRQYKDSVKQTEEQADELVALWNDSFTEGMRKRLEKVKGGKFLMNEMMTLQSMRADGLTPSEELVSEAAKDLKTVAGKLRKVSPGEFRLHEMQQLGFRPLDFKALSNLGSLGIFTGANEKNAATLVGKTSQMVDYLMKIEHNTEQWSVTYA